MSLMAPPNQSSSPAPRPPGQRRSPLAAEWQHWVEIPYERMALMLLPTALLICISPSLPLVAYVLQVWASSWAWRDRWPSITVFAKGGCWFVAGLLTYMVLASAHIWGLAHVLTGLQGLWHTSLPGELSLNPLDVNSLLARTLLLLPLAPALALYYEYVDPRASHEPQERKLTPADLIQPPASAPPARTTSTPPSQEQAGTQSAGASGTRPAAQRARPKTTHATTPPTPQKAIESTLAPPSWAPVSSPAFTNAPAKPATSAQAAPSKTPRHASSPPPSESTQVTAPRIDWDNVAE